MYYVYLLKTESTKNQFYIGVTSDLRRRIDEHNRGIVKTTHRLKKPKLIYYEAYESKDRPEEREKMLKQFGSSYMGLLKRLGFK